MPNDIGTPIRVQGEVTVSADGKGTVVVQNPEVVLAKVPNLER
jgi:hypothetical protein